MVVKLIFTQALIMGKITVRHYLNMNLKPYVIDGENYYKVYVLIRANTQNTKIKSDISSSEYTESEFKSLVSNKKSELSEAIKIETELIEFIVNKIISDKKIFTSALYGEYSNRFKTPIGKFILTHNSYHDRLFSSRKERYLEVEYDYFEIIKNNIWQIKGILSNNLDIGDLYVAQWFIGDYKQQIIDLLLQRTVQGISGESENQLFQKIQRLETEIKSFINLQ